MGPGSEKSFHHRGTEDTEKVGMSLRTAQYETRCHIWCGSRSLTGTLLRLYPSRERLGGNLGGAVFVVGDEEAFGVWDGFGTWRGCDRF